MPFGEPFDMSFFENTMRRMEQDMATFWQQANNRLGNSFDSGFGSGFGTDFFADRRPLTMAQSPSRPPTPNTAQLKAVPQEHFAQRINPAIQQRQPAVPELQQQLQPQIVKRPKNLPQQQQLANRTPPSNMQLATKQSKPMLIDESDAQNFRVRFDMGPYAAQEVQVNVDKGQLRIQAEHSEKTPTRTMRRIYRQVVSLPSGIDPQAVQTLVGKDGMISVEAPLVGGAARSKPGDLELTLD